MNSGKRKKAGAVFLLVFAESLLILAFGVLRGHGGAGQLGTPSLGLRSSSFSDHAIPRTSSSCDHQDGASAELSWSAPAQHTQSFALIVTRTLRSVSSLRTGCFTTSSDKRDLPENTPKREQLPDGSRHGNNDYDRIGYAGPCPPKGNTSLRGYAIRPRYKAEPATRSVEEAAGQSNERVRSG